MGRISQKKHEEANDALINAVKADSKFESLKEILTMLASEDGSKTFAELVQAQIEAGIDDGGAIKTWADATYEPKSEL